jgi:hypothetical protein
MAALSYLHSTLSSVINHEDPVEEKEVLLDSSPNRIVKGVAFMWRHRVFPEIAYGTKFTSTQNVFKGEQRSGLVLA